MFGFICGALVTVEGLCGLFRDSGRSLGVHRVDPVVCGGFPNTLGLFRAFERMKGVLGVSVKDF